MNKYVILCTEEQTRKALALGVPIESQEYCSKGGLPEGWFVDGERCYHKPTAEQMFGWLEEYIDSISIIKNNNGKWLFIFYPTIHQEHKIESGFQTRREATLAAIVVALDYLKSLSKNKD